MNDDYEIISQREIRKLREQLKGIDSGKAVDVNTLHRTVSELDEKLGSLLDIFSAAVDDMREEDKESEIIKDKINPIIEKLDQIDDQNKKLAQGMVAVNDLLEEKLGQITEVIKSISMSQQELKDSVKDAIQEMKVSSTESSFSSMRMRSSPSLDTQLDLGKDLPPLPSSKESAKLGADKRKFRLF